MARRVLFAAFLALAGAMPARADMPQDADHGFYAFIKGKGQGGAAAESEVIEGKLAQTMDAAGYTYMEVDTGKAKVWMATRKTKVAKGDAIAFPKTEPFHDFHSKTLNRTFGEIYFVSQLAVNGQVIDTTEDAGPAAAAPAPAKAEAAAKADAPAKAEAVVKAPPAKAGEKPTRLTLAEVLAKRSSLNGRPVVVKGKVVKVNNGIMGKNWVHIVDASLNAKTQDLTLTTDATVAVGDAVEVTGVLAVDKDIGSGYSFPALIEDAKVVPKR